jgi:hypothetical protein
MYQNVGGRLIWVSERSPRWKEWRGKAIYRQRYGQVRKPANY